MKTILIGLALLFAGCNDPTTSKINDLPAPPELKNGRFQLVQLGTFRSDQYLLDNQTGKLWRSVCAYGSGANGACEYSIWEPADVMGISASSDEIYKRIDAHRDRDSAKHRGKR